MLDLAADDRVALVELDAAVRVLSARLLPGSHHSGVVDVLSLDPAAIGHSRRHRRRLGGCVARVWLPGDRGATASAHDDDLLLTGLRDCEVVSSGARGAEPGPVGGVVVSVSLDWTRARGAFHRLASGRWRA